MGVFFLPGPLSGRTAFCIGIGNITFIHMAKLHLPNMYMNFVDNFKENNDRNPFDDTPNFFTVSGSYATLSSSLPRILWDRSNFFRVTFCFFCVFDRRASRKSEINVPTIFVPRPMMVVELNQNYLELGEEIHSLWI